MKGKEERTRWRKDDMKGNIVKGKAERKERRRWRWKANEERLERIVTERKEDEGGRGRREKGGREGGRGMSECPSFPPPHQHTTHTHTILALLRESRNHHRTSPPSNTLRRTSSKDSLSGKFFSSDEATL